MQIRQRVFDSKIPHPIVRLVNLETKRLDPPLPLQDVIASFDPKEYRIELMRADPEDGGEPIVRVITREAARSQKDQDKLRVKALRKNNATRKQIQMSWGVEMRDLERKMEKVRDEIAKKNEIDIVLAKKKDVMLPSLAEKLAKMDVILETVADIAEERMPRSMGSQLAIMFLKPKKIVK